MNLEETIHDLIMRHPAVTNVELTGSRRRGNATRWSDWDFLVETTDFKAVSSALPELIEEVNPLSYLWDPLSRHSIFMMILHGPIKVDIIFNQLHQQELPLSVNRDNLELINNHFWDWILWIASKEISGVWDRNTFQDELEKMYNHILAPLDCIRKVVSIQEAVRNFSDAFRIKERLYKIEINPALKLEITKGLKMMGYPL